jgi:hypothetical protein
LRLAYVVGMAFSPYFIFLLHLSFVVIAIFLMKYTLKTRSPEKKNTLPDVRLLIGGQANHEPPLRLHVAI